jgi:hypothetical protein
MPAEKFVKDILRTALFGGGQYPRVVEGLSRMMAPHWMIRSAP